MLKFKSKNTTLDRFIVPRKEVNLSPEEALEKVFGLKEGFRGRQKEIITAALEGKDVLVLMQTGGGKSLCYQLPAVLSLGITLVISPLLALIQNQVEQLQDLGIKAATLNSSVAKKVKEAILMDLSGGQTPKLKLLYVTPELLATPAFRKTLIDLFNRKLLARIVVDECHCISEWGHDFRSDYLKLGYWKETFPSLQIMALTATATLPVYKDIIRQLALKDPVTFISSFSRPNLHYEVRFKPENNDPREDVLAFLKNIYKNRKARLAGSGSTQRVEGVCGIIYCSTRASCDSVAGVLRQGGVRAACYHAGLGQKERKTILTAWTGTEDTRVFDSDVPYSSNIKSDQAVTTASVIDVVVATISFGMGIDKKNVRFVIHWDLPKSMEGYYQESGRAGRDGKVSRCILYYSTSDRDKALFLLKKNSSDDLEREKNSLSQESFQYLVSYCESYTVCRHKLINDFFSKGMEKTSLAAFLPKVPNTCADNRCDYCKNPERLRETATAYLDSQPGYGQGGRQSLLEIGAGTTSMSSNGFQTARERQESIRLKDGTLASFAPFKRQYDTFLDDTTEEKLRKSSGQSFPGFKSASELHQEGVGGETKETYSRKEFGFKKEKKDFGTDQPDPPSKYPLLYPLHFIPGCQNRERDGVIDKMVTALNKYIPYTKKSAGGNDFPGRALSFAIKKEGEIYRRNTLAVIYKQQAALFVGTIIKGSWDDGLSKVYNDFKELFITEEDEIVHID